MERRTQLLYKDIFLALNDKSSSFRLGRGLAELHCGYGIFVLDLTIVEHLNF